MEAKNLTRNLDNLNAIKLDIALNYSVFLNEIMNKRINSYFAAKEAVFNALSDLKNCTEAELAAEEMRDSLICIEILIIYKITKKIQNMDLEILSIFY